MREHEHYNLRNRNVYHLQEALCRYWPGAEWSVSGDDIKTLIWHDKKVSRPSDNEIKEKAKLVKKEYESSQYKRDRVEAYNTRGATHHDLVVALYEKVVENRDDEINEIQKARETIKKEIPKPKD
jgi:hypothetical protein